MSRFGPRRAVVAARRIEKTTSRSTPSTRRRDAVDATRSSLLASRRGVDLVHTQVKSDDAGNIDLDDFKAKAEKHKDHLSAIMVTYPSTYGVFEETITDLTRITHECGGQVYMDGANLNARPPRPLRRFHFIQTTRVHLTMT